MLNILANVLPLKNPKREAKHQLQVAQLELLEAQAAQEHWAARVDELKRRTIRLAREMETIVCDEPVSWLERLKQAF